MMDFIETYDKVFPEGFCEHLIKCFEESHSKGITKSREDWEGGTSRIKKHDYAMMLNGPGVGLDPFDPIPHLSVQDICFEGIQKCFDQYVSKYSTLKDVDVRATDLKMQKIPHGGGYHIWHAEQGNGHHQSCRVLTWMIYLNSLSEEQNGTTEFLFQERMVSPQENLGVFWPAAFTHAHRGNPVYSGGEKYILTGWFFLE
jgi:hypothetical protein